MLDLTRAAFDLPDRGESGRPSPAPSEAFVFTERGVYRPGETTIGMMNEAGRRLLPFYGHGQSRDSQFTIQQSFC
jgi:hypothetical protein